MEEKYLLVDESIAGFLEAVYLGRPDDMEPLSKAIGVLANIMRISQICAFSTIQVEQEVTVYKRYDTKLLNMPDWEYTESVYAPEDVRIRFWKEEDREWQDPDFINMKNLARFIILYVG
ncbi:MAG TPA: hypothetical protein PLU43_02275, partial [Lachnospiraceae bacterium]|nr:hypothetical protein [Lachnospiraceae bacterium]